jgi:hypothetical protein
VGVELCHDTGWKTAGERSRYIMAVTLRGLTGPDTASSHPRLFRKFNLQDARVKVTCAAVWHKGLLAGLPAVSRYLV